MSIEATIWHYPRCSKSRKTLAILRNQKASITMRDYLEDPPDADTLAEVVELLKIRPYDLVRKSENLYHELDVDAGALSDRDWLELMADNPLLIQRPIVLTENGAVIGRPPEQVHEILPTKE